MRRILNDEKTAGMRIVRKPCGFTIIELIIALVILAVLITIATSIYLNYIGTARVTVANSVLDNAGKTLLNYEMEKGRYPASIDFASCSDNNGGMVFPPSLCDQIREELYSVDSYVLNDKSYVLTARARDKKHTLLTLTDGKITIQGK
jgi:prepilin-type N-terminal cleavage/methylation domain-containing protein